MAWRRAALQRSSIVYADDIQPQKRRLFASLAPLAYEDASGAYQQIDMTSERVQTQAFNGWRVTNNGWHYGLTTSGQVWFGGRRGANFFKFRLHRIGYTNVEQGSTPDFATDFTDIGGAPTYNTANLSNTTSAISVPDGAVNVKTTAEWRNIWTPPQGEIYARWRADGNRLKEDVVITQAAREWIVANRPPSFYGLTASQTWLTFAFQIDFSDVPRRVLRGVGDVTDSTDFDDSSGELEARTALGELLFFMPIDYAYVDESIDTGRVDNNGDPIYETQRHGVQLRKRFWRDGSGQWYLVVGAKVADIAALPAGSLIFDPTLNSSVSASADDRNSNNTYGELDRPEIFIGRGVGPTAAGIRFTNISLSSTDTVDNVYLTVVPTNSSWNRQQIIFNFEDADNPGDFSSDYPEDRTVLSTGGVLYSWDHQYSAGTPNIWPPNTPEQESLGSLLQQVISRPGWASGNAIVLLDNHPDDANIGSAATYGYNVASYDNTTYDAPAIAIEYTAGSSGTSANVGLSVARGTDLSATAQAGAVSAGVGVTAAQTVSPAVTAEATTQAAVGVSSAQTVSPSITAQAGPVTATMALSTARTTSPDVTPSEDTQSVGVSTSTAQTASPAASAQPGTVSVNAGLSVARTASPNITASEDTQSVGVSTSTAQTTSPSASAEPGTLSAAVAASVARAVSYGVNAGEDLQTVGVTASIARAQSYATTAQPGGITATAGLSIARAVSLSATAREVLSPGVAGVSIHIDEAAGVVVVTQHDAELTITTTHAIELWVGAE